jgi:NAD(P)H dehydrogenase (quinone)
MSGEIAIIGSTGRNSAAWIEAFAAAGFSVRNLVRDPSAHSPRPGIAYVAFDLDDRAAYQQALDGVDLFALVTPADPRQTERELALLEAAKAAKVRRILNLSVIGADLPAPITPFARWQAVVEKALRESGVTHVTLRPNAFMQNILLQRSAIEAGRYVEPAGANAASLIDVRDIAAVAVLAAGGAYDGEALELTGSEAITGAEIAEILSETSGKPVRFASPTIEAFCSGLRDQGAPSWRVEALAELYQATRAGRAGHIARVSAQVRTITGRPPRSLRDFAKEAFQRRP